jgi:phosphoglycerate dehydrogenase-like enzyme
MKVFIGPAPLRDIEHAYAPALTAAGHELKFGPPSHLLSADQVLELLPGCDASLAGSEPYTAKTIAVAADRGLKVIARAGVGYDAVDLAAATDHGVAVCIGPGTNDNAVAEHAMLLLLAQAKQLLFQDKETRLGTWPRKAFEPVRGQTLGIIGLGRTGKALARRAKAFDMSIMAYDIVWDEDFVKHHGIEKANSPEDVFSRADYLSLHVPLTPITKHLVCERTLKLMKPTAYLVNTSRGPVVNETDLEAALKAKVIAGAGLDVYDKEPLKAGHGLAALPNVILTAHTAGVDRKSRVDMAAAAAKAIIELLQGRWLPDGWCVNPEVKEKFLSRVSG